MKLLLQEHEKRPVGQHNINGKSEVLILCPHAGNRIPQNLENLGLTEIERQQHIALDIGALDLAIDLSNQIDAPVIYQNYSRLLIDCNRCLSNQELIPCYSANIKIPGNQTLSDREKQQRIVKIWQPYQTAIRKCLDEKLSKGISTIIIDLHSFTPILNGIERPWHIGLLFNRHPETAQAFQRFLIELDDNLVIGMNQPYKVLDEEDYAIPVFGERRGLKHVLIEVRQDLLQTNNGIKKWSDLFSMVCNNLISVC